MVYSITINGADRTTDVLNQSVEVEDVLNDRQNLCKFRLIDRSGGGIPSPQQEVIITLADATILFGGYIIEVVKNKMESGVVEAEISCQDYAWILDRFLAHKSYEDMTDKAIIEDLITKLRQARENSESLIEQNKKSIEERDVFRDAFKASDRMIKSLNQELEKYKLGKVPIYPSGDALQNALEAAFYENPAILGQKRQLGQRNNTNPFSIFLNPTKK